MVVMVLLTLFAIVIPLMMSFLSMYNIVQFNILLQKTVSLLYNSYDEEEKFIVSERGDSL